MKKKGMFAILGMVMALALMASPVMAFDSTDHVAVAPNMEGDVLVYPLYIAADGLQTDFEVINTSDTLATVVKIVLRSHKYSQEVLDFLIYLSHNDVFTATIFYANGKYQLTSSDESLCLSNGTCASAAAPLTFALTPPCDGIVDSESMGYITAIEAWAGYVAEDPDDPGTQNKLDIKDTYETALEGALDTCDTADIITGNAKVDFVGSDISMYNADVLKNYRNLEHIEVATETILGANANNNLCEIEGALSKNHLAVPYFNSVDAASLLIATLPTKLATCPDAAGDYTALGPFFRVDQFLEPEYTATLYDMEEHSFQQGCTVSPCPPDEKNVLPEEVNLILMTSTYTRGWGRINFVDGAVDPVVTTCNDKSDSQLTYTGAPVVSLIAHFTADGFMFTRPAYNWGIVNGSLLEGEYQLLSGPSGGAYRQCGG